jgi:uncharacterized iron-regulated membrane protein
LENPKRKNQARTLRQFRKVHRYTGISLFFLFFFISITGILLGWKKNSAELLLAKSYQGTTSDLKKWLPIDSLNNIASNILHDSISPNLSTKIDRIDIRKEKGMVKFIYQDHYWGIQLDGATGELLSLRMRRSDFVENIHDGSILDISLNNKNGLIKLIYTTISGLALLTFTITGFWLWYGPKRIRKKGRGHL